MKEEKPREEGAGSRKEQKRPRSKGGRGYKKPLKEERPRVEGTGSRKEQERPRGRGSRGYKPAVEVRKTQRGGCRSV